MVNLKEHVKIGKPIALMLLVLFSLSPCSAKQRLLDAFNIDYSSPLNKTRAAGNANNSCSFNTITAVSRSFIKLKKDQVYSNTNFSTFDRLRNTSTLDHGSGLRAGSSPPKYILYKRLKVYLA